MQGREKLSQLDLAKVRRRFFVEQLLSYPKMGVTIKWEFSHSDKTILFGEHMTFYDLKNWVSLNWFERPKKEGVAKIIIDRKN